MQASRQRRRVAALRPQARPRSSRPEATALALRYCRQRRVNWFPPPWHFNRSPFRARRPPAASTETVHGPSLLPPDPSRKGYSTYREPVEQIAGGRPLAPAYSPARTRKGRWWVLRGRETASTHPGAATGLFQRYNPSGTFYGVRALRVGGFARDRWHDCHAVLSPERGSRYYRKANERLPLLKFAAKRKFLPPIVAIASPL
jgi:hypothetical protein